MSNPEQEPRRMTARSVLSDAEVEEATHATAGSRVNSLRIARELQQARAAIKEALNLLCPWDVDAEAVLRARLPAEERHDA